MIRKFVTVGGWRIVGAAILGLILSGTATLHAQDSTPPPAQQEPSAQQAPQQKDSGSQEATPEESTPIHKNRPKGYDNWQFSAGGGASLTNGTTTKYAKGGGGVIAASVARNGSRYVGLRFDAQFDDLPLRNSALMLAQAPSATSYTYSFMLGPIVNIPVNKDWGGYVTGGVAYFHRAGKLSSSTAISGSPCNAFFAWWGGCYNVSLGKESRILTADQNMLGENFGVGITRAIRKNMEVYAEVRILHGSHIGITTDLRPITVGIRW